MYQPTSYNLTLFCCFVSHEEQDIVVKSVSRSSELGCLPSLSLEIAIWRVWQAGLDILTIDDIQCISYEKVHGISVIADGKGDA
jgi:hypothetical protein